MLIRARIVTRSRISAVSDWSARAHGRRSSDTCSPSCERCCSRRTEAKLRASASHPLRPPSLYSPPSRTHFRRCPPLLPSSAPTPRHDYSAPLKLLSIPSARCRHAFLVCRTSLAVSRAFFLSSPVPPLSNNCSRCFLSHCPINPSNTLVKHAFRSQASPSPLLGRCTSTRPAGLHRDKHFEHSDAIVSHGACLPVLCHVMLIWSGCVVVGCNDQEKRAGCFALCCRLKMC